MYDVPIGSKNPVRRLHSHFSQDKNSEVVSIYEGCIRWRFKMFWSCLQSVQKIAEMLFKGVY